MTRLATASAALVLIFVLCVLAARLVGTRNGRQPALLAGLGDCDLPCWHGIVPGQTVVTDADKILNQQGYSMVGAYSASDLVYRVVPRDCWALVSLFERRVIELRFSGCEPVTLGDLMGTLGPPDRMALSAGAGPALFWREGRYAVSVLGWPSPRVRIGDLGLSVAVSASLGTPWHGFVPLWRYCRLEFIPLECEVS